MEDSYGETHTRQKRIKISNLIPHQVQRETLFHELIHASFAETPVIELIKDLEDNEKIEEAIVRTLSPILLQVLLENQEVSDFILGNRKTIKSS